MNRELPGVQAEFRKGRGTRDQIANTRWIIEKAREFQKNICFIDYAKAFDFVNHKQNMENSQSWEYQATLPAFLETCIQVKKQQLEPEQWTGSKLEKEYVKAVYCHLVYLTYMQCTLCEMPDWMKHNLESRFLGEISVTSDTDNTILRAESEEELKSLSMKVKEESEKAGLKLNIQKTKIMASGPITSW